MLQIRNHTKPQNNCKREMRQIHPTTEAPPCIIRCKSVVKVHVVFVRLDHAVCLNTWEFWVVDLFCPLWRWKDPVFTKKCVFGCFTPENSVVCPHLCRCVLTQFLKEVAFILCPFSTTPWLESCERDTIPSTSRQTQNLFSKPLRPRETFSVFM